MKMSFSSKYFTATAFYLMLILIQIYGEFIVLRYPVNFDDKLNKFICLADDDDAALIWNYDLNITKPSNGDNSLADFQPKKLKPENLIRCAVRNSSTCIVSWENGNGWDTVNSSMNPMAPVYDFRWEDFEEFIFEKSIVEQEYRYVGKVNKSMGTVVFSARGSNDFYILLCENINPHKEGCFWIIIGGWSGNVSAIRLCNEGAPEPTHPSPSEHCEDIANVTHKHVRIVDLSEWRTFTLKWDDERKKIQIFTGHEDEPFLTATLPKWHSGRHLLVRSDISSRFRFHFYKYLLSEQKNVRLTTEPFPQFGISFCVKLLVGLCFECELHVTLLNTEGNTIKAWQIFGNESSIHDELLTWRSIELRTYLAPNNTKSFRIAISTILNKKEGRGQWAIDNFRFCKPGGGIRESTKLIHPRNLNKNDPTIKCQKLSFNQSVVLDALSKTEFNDTSNLQKFLRRAEESCGTACAKLGEKWSICDETGCTCDRAYEGRNCETPCHDGFYGYNCKRRCGSCNRAPCNKITGHCVNGCQHAGYLRPFCETEVPIPSVTEITATTATVSLELELGTDTDVDLAIHFIMTNKESKTELYELPAQMTRSTYEAELKHLTPSTVYEVHAGVSVISEDSATGTNSSKALFTTTGVEGSCIEVLPEERKLTVKSLRPGKKCRERTILDLIIKVLNRRGTLACSAGTGFPYTCMNLTLDTEYRVEIYQTNKVIFGKKVRTLKLAPGKPQMLTSITQSHGIVELKWKYLSIGHMHVKQFYVHIERLKTELQKTPDMPDPMDVTCTVMREKDDYSMQLYLSTSTVYNVSVVAIDEHNSTSMEIVTEISVPGSVGFATGEKLQVIQNGSSISVKTPTIVNATHNTTVSIIINEHERFALNQSLVLAACGNTKEYKEGGDKSEYLKIEIMESEDDDFDGCLCFGRTYSIMAIVKDFSSNSSATLTSSPITLNADKQNFAWLVIFPIAAISLLLFIWHRKRMRALHRRVSQDNIPLSSTMASTGNSTFSDSVRPPTPLPDTIDRRVSIYESGPHVASCKFHFNSVEVKEFEDFAKDAMASGLLDTEFMLLSTGPTKKCKYGKLPKNLLKNRYENLIPYDDTRVILKKIPGDSHSDYINASYIEGYRKKRGYIATQGPKPNTVNDFWRMVWQERVQVICMLTNPTEDGKSSCEQYWPEVGTASKYGNIDVFNAEHEVFADYTIRNLNLCYKNINRTVTHLHYTGWPAEWVPMYTQSLVAYLKKLLATPTGKGPVIVHCSAGVGRTGTIILCDICLRQAVSEKIFDLPNVIRRMREGRPNMVENVQQYFLAHLVIVESMVVEQTQIPCDHSFPNRIQSLREQLPSDIQRLKDTVWQERELHSLAVIKRPSSHHMGTNRLPEFVPASPVESQFKRDSIFDSESNYINAVSVDGVKMKKQYLQASLPTPSTLCEYWRLIAEKRIELILVLQPPDRDDPTCCNVISKDSTLIPLPYIQVEIKSSVDVQEHFTTQKFLMTDTSRGKLQTITVLTCVGWKCEKNEKPPTAAALVSLWMASEKVSRKEASSLVLCQDGVTGCGLYLALSFLLERMAVERECDVISAVRAVRRSRTEFVQSLEQFEYLYDAAVNYYECFQTYANFL